MPIILIGPIIRNGGRVMMKFRIRIRPYRRFTFPPIFHPNDENTILEGPYQIGWWKVFGQIIIEQDSMWYPCYLPMNIGGHDDEKEVQRMFDGELVQLLLFLSTIDK